MYTHVFRYGEHNGTISFALAQVLLEKIISSSDNIQCLRWRQFSVQVLIISGQIPPPPSKLHNAHLNRSYVLKYYSNVLNNLQHQKTGILLKSCNNAPFSKFHQRLIPTEKQSKNKWDQMEKKSTISCFISNKFFRSLNVLLIDITIISYSKQWICMAEIGLGKHSLWPLP